MRYRFLAGALISAPTVVIVALWLVRIPIAGQAPASTRTAARTTAANSGTPGRTPWGEPELQGIWGQTTQTPLQRPEQFAGREFLTDEEVAALDQQRAALPGHEFRATRGTDLDVAGAYNQVFASVKRSGKRTSLIVDPPDGRIPALTPEAQKRIAAMKAYESALLQGTPSGKAGPPSPRRAEAPPMYNVVRLNRADGPEDRSLGERCLDGTLPDFNAFYRIVQSPGYVTIFYDTGQGQGFHRVIPIIPIDGSRPRLPQHIRQWWGDPRGGWEGNTLVVDTANFTHKTDYQGSRENLHLIERFTRIDANTLNYEVTIDDPTTWTKRWTIAVPWARQDEKANRIFEPTCHEGNYAMTGILSNTRAAEKAFVEGRGPNPATKDTAMDGANTRDPAVAGELDPLR
jgi:hypothetical protein